MAWTASWPQEPSAEPLAEPDVSLATHSAQHSAVPDHHGARGLCIPSCACTTFSTGAPLPPDHRASEVWLKNGLLSHRSGEETRRRGRSGPRAPPALLQLPQQELAALTLPQLGSLSPQDSGSGRGSALGTLPEPTRCNVPREAATDAPAPAACQACNPALCGAWGLRPQPVDPP